MEAMSKFMLIKTDEDCNIYTALVEASSWRTALDWVSDVEFEEKSIDDLGHIMDGYNIFSDEIYPIEVKESDSKQRFTGQTEKFEQSFNKIFINGESND